jgi:hypothetical protein
LEVPQLLPVAVAPAAPRLQTEQRFDPAGALVVLADAARWSVKRLAIRRLHARADRGGGGGGGQRAGAGCERSGDPRGAQTGMELIGVVPTAAGAGGQKVQVISR